MKFVRSESVSKRHSQRIFVCEQCESVNPGSTVAACAFHELLQPSSNVMVNRMTPETSLSDCCESLALIETSTKKVSGGISCGLIRLVGGATEERTGRQASKLIFRKFYSLQNFGLCVSNFVMAKATLQFAEPCGTTVNSQANGPERL